MKIHGLTPQQHRIAALVAKAMTDKSIAKELGILESSVNNHLQNIARAWALDSQRNRRVQIAMRFQAIAA